MGMSNIEKELYQISGALPAPFNGAVAKQSFSNNANQIPRHPPSSFVNKRTFGRDLSNIQQNNVPVGTS
jgi:hypothetical protein